MKFLKALERHVNALLNETQDFEAAAANKGARVLGKGCGGCHAALRPCGQALEQVFDDVFHVLLLVWRPLLSVLLRSPQLSFISLSLFRHSKYYNSLARLAVIVRQICNSLIAQAQLACTSNLIQDRIASDLFWRPLVTSREAARPPETCLPVLPECPHLQSKKVFEMILQSEAA